MRYTKIIAMIMASTAVAAAYGEGLNLSPGQYEARYRAKIQHEQNAVLLTSKTAEWDAGLRINPPKGKKFDFSGGKYLAVDVENLSPDRQMRLTMHISSGARGKSSNSHVELPLREINTGIGLNPGEKRTMRLYLPHAALFTPPKGGRNFKRPLETSQINSIEFKMQWPFEPEGKTLLNCRLSNIRLEGKPDMNRKVSQDDKNYFPFIDRYGQYKHCDWPEKIHNDEDLKKNHAKELAELNKTPSPAEWNRFGGWKNGPKMKATGNFYVTKHKGKWFFVDPEGCLFWSLGIDVLRHTSDAVNARRHPTWFEGKIPASGMFDFNAMNLEKKYGKKDYLDEFHAVLDQRLRAWGINSVGNWASGTFLQKTRTPYTLSLGERSSNVSRHGFPGLGKVNFYDVFSPDFEEKMGNILRDVSERDAVVKKSLTDPLCIGYFIDNELRFGDIIKGVMQGGPNQAAKQEFIGDLRGKYKDIQKLNQAWNTRYETWDDLAVSNQIPRSGEFRKDARRFEEKFVDRYFKICRKGIKSIAPDRLYLGCRFVGFRQGQHIWNSAAKYCDVISVNTYCNSIYNANAGDFRDRPVLIGEFHFGTYDRGMFSNSLAPVADQKERAVSFTRYVQGALVHPNFIGVHWFQFRDQPLTGRWDGEGYQIGFTDVADTPYPEMTRAAREAGENLYHYRTNGILKNSMK